MDQRIDIGKPRYTPRDHLKPGRVARTEPERARQHAEIKSRHSRTSKKDDPQRHVALLRINDIEIYCRASDVPADGGLDHLTIAANHLAFIYRKTAAKIAAIVAWSRRFTPSIPPDKARLLAARIVANPRMPTADKLGWRLGLTMERRAALGITTIGAIDMDKAERLVLRKKKDAEGARLRRAAKSSGKPRGRPSKGKPWLELGISKTTYYDRRTKMRRQRSLSIHADDGISSGPPPQPAAPPHPAMYGGASIASAGSAEVVIAASASPHLQTSGPVVLVEPDEGEPGQASSATSVELCNWRIGDAVGGPVIRFPHRRRDRGDHPQRAVAFRIEDMHRFTEARA